MNRRIATARLKGRGAALLEVVLALSLLFVAAAVVVVAMNSALNALNASRAEVQAASLCQTVLARMSAGILPVEDEGPTAFEEDDAAPGWTYTTTLTPVVLSGGQVQLVLVEVLVQHESGRSSRIAQFMQDPAQLEGPLQ